MNQLNWGQTCIGVYGGMAIIEGPCTVTGEMYQCSIPFHELNVWLIDGKYIQDAMPSVSAEDREFLVSGTSPRGWKELFE